MCKIDNIVFEQNFFSFAMVYINKHLTVTEVFLPYILCIRGRKSESLDADKVLSTPFLDVCRGCCFQKKTKEKKEGHSNKKKGCDISVASK